MQIERGVPIPAKCAVQVKYPIAQLAVGESFFVSAKPERVRALSMVLASCMSQQMKKTGNQFTQRRSAKPCGIRVWRTS